MNEPLTDETIQDYIDGRLNEVERAAVAARLLADPKLAAEVENLRRQNEALKVIGREILSEPVPERLRAILHRPAPTAPRRGWWRSIAFVEAAAAILLFCAGGALGWYANELLRPRPGMLDIIVAEVTDAFTFYGSQDYPVEFPPDRTADFVSWIGRSFEREVPPPDLAKLGYDYRGGRLLPAAGSSLGLFQFAGAKRGRLAVFFWKANAMPDEVTALTRRENVSIRLWHGGGLSFAVVSDAGNPEFEQAADAVFTFFKEKFAAN